MWRLHFAELFLFLWKKEFLLQLLLLVITTRNHLKTVITGEVKTKNELKK